MIHLVPTPWHPDLIQTSEFHHPSAPTSLPTLLLPLRHSSSLFSTSYLCFFLYFFILSRLWSKSWVALSLSPRMSSINTRYASSGALIVPKNFSGRTRRYPKPTVSGPSYSASLPDPHYARSATMAAARGLCCISKRMSYRCFRETLCFWSFRTPPHALSTF